MLVASRDRKRLVYNAIDIACQSRALSHGPVGSETRDELVRQALAILEKLPEVSAHVLASELLRWIVKTAAQSGALVRLVGSIRGGSNPVVLDAAY